MDELRENNDGQKDEKSVIPGDLYSLMAEIITFAQELNDLKDEQSNFE
ncbi:hypothetical protein IJT10_05190 [bacterium]|nr:hypothetical protein [bacterium]